LSRPPIVVISAADNALREFNTNGCPDCIETSPLPDFFAPFSFCAILALASLGFATRVIPSAFCVSAEILPAGASSPLIPLPISLS